jgi:hypothetical protein
MMLTPEWNWRLSMASTVTPRAVSSFVAPSITESPYAATPAGITTGSGLGGAGCCTGSGGVLGVLDGDDDTCGTRVRSRVMRPLPHPVSTVVAATPTTTRPSVRGKDGTHPR